jgi:hypothetical protein
VITTRREGWENSRYSLMCREIARPGILPD